MRQVLDCGDDILEAFFKLALHARPGLQQPQVQAHDLDFAQKFRGRALGDFQGQALNQRGLADTGLAHHNRIVLASPAQNVDHLTDFGLASEHRIDVSGPRLSAEVDAEPGQGAVLGRVVRPGCGRSGAVLRRGRGKFVKPLAQAGQPAVLQQSGGSAVHIALGPRRQGRPQRG